VFSYRPVERRRVQNPRSSGSSETVAIFRNNTPHRSEKLVSIRSDHCSPSASPPRRLERSSIATAVSPGTRCIRRRKNRPRRPAETHRRSRSLPALARSARGRGPAYPPRPRRPASSAGRVRISPATTPSGRCCSRWRIDLGERQWLAGGLRSELRADRLQSQNAGATAGSDRRRCAASLPSPDRSGLRGPLSVKPVVIGVIG
jgi:hypothetical protein